MDRARSGADDGAIEFNLRSGGDGFKFHFFVTRKALREEYRNESREDNCPEWKVKRVGLPKNSADKATTNCCGCGMRVAGARGEGIGAIRPGVVLIFCRFLCRFTRDLARVAEWHTRRT